MADIDLHKSLHLPPPPLTALCELRTADMELRKSVTPHYTTLNSYYTLKTVWFMSGPDK